jgi:hypothetical protein
MNLKIIDRKGPAMNMDAFFEQLRKNNSIPQKTVKEQDREWEKWITTPEATLEILQSRHSDLAAIRPSERTKYLLQMIKKGRKDQ